MWDKNEYFKGMSFVRITFLILLFFGAMIIISQVRAQEKDSLRYDTSKYGWPTQVVYDTIGACYQGTYKWIVMTNPSLIGSMPPPQTQRKMVEHCFCVLDRIRIQYSYVEYVQSVTNQTMLSTLYYTTALTCVSENNTLNGIMILEPKDNETMEENKIPKTPIKPKEPQDSKEESSPDQPKEESNGLPETIFQG